MLFSDRKDKNYNIPFRLFTNQFYYSYTKVGTFMIKDAIGPDGGNSISRNRISAMKKSFSEMIERRSLMIGSDIENTNKIKAFNLVDKKVYDMLERHIKFSVEEGFYTDTTGTATHISSYQAIFKAFKELIEKNSLFLFWYAGRGMKIDYKEAMIKYGINLKFNYNYQLYLFINDDFYPILTTIAILTDKEKILGSGIAGDVDLKDSINSSLQELMLLKEQKDINRYYSFFFNQTLKNNPNLKNEYDHLIKLTHLPYFDIKKYNNTGFYKKVNMFRIIQLMPPWIKTLYCVFIRHNINNQLKTVRVFSEELYNHIPLKNRISDNKQIYKQYNMNESLIKKTPDCPII